MKRINVVGIACAALLCTVVASPPARGALPMPVTGLAFDEVTKFIMGDATPPEPGTFAADFAAAVNTQKAPPAHRGLLGGIMNTVDMAKNAVNLFKTGTAVSKAYLGRMERTDDLSTQTATIAKPQQHQLIMLNLAKKTYRIIDTNAPEQPETSTPVDRGRAQPGPRERPGPPPQPGTGKLDMTVSSTQIGPKVVENIPTTGYRVSFSLAETQSTGSCQDGNFKTAMVSYVSNYVQPQPPSAPVAMGRPAMPPMRPELSAMQPGCAPTITSHVVGGAQPPPDRLALWSLMTVSAGAPSAQGPMNGGFSTLIERGNVRVLGVADKTLFEIPADFTRES